jgi:hypothetical protein
MRPVNSCLILQGVPSRNLSIASVTASSTLLEVVEEMVFTESRRDRETDKPYRMVLKYH